MKRVLERGIEGIDDHAYIAFMGPPIPPYKIQCYCGHVIKVGRDENGYYIEGADKVIFEQNDKRLR